MWCCHPDMWPSDSALADGGERQLPTNTRNLCVGRRSVCRRQGDRTDLELNAWRVLVSNSAKNVTSPDDTYFPYFVAGDVI